MEFEDEHDEEQEEEEDEVEDEITIPPPAPVVVPPRLNSVQLSRARVSTERRSSVVRYRECLKNHAVSIGGHALDGCGEFMAAGEEGTLDALKCAACNCHRNFHRKEADHSGDILPVGVGGGVGVNHTFQQQHHQVVAPAGAVAAAGALYPQFSAYYRTPGSGSGYPHYVRPPLAILPSNSGGTHSGEMGDDMSHPSTSGGGDGRPENGGGGGSPMMIVPRKRFRTKFTQDQKDKMLEFAEKLGWRIQKHDEAAVQQFCGEVQINRQVLKVWMHNNKHTLGKKPYIN